MLYSYRVLPDRSMRREWFVDNPYVPPIDIATVSMSSCWSDVVVPEDRETVLARARRLLAGERSVDQVQAVAGDSQPLDLHLLGVPSLNAGGVERILGSVSVVSPGRTASPAAESMWIEKGNQIAALQAQISAREDQLHHAFEQIADTSETLRRYRLMLREYTHRSKNNVQLAVSLVRSIKRNADCLSKEQLDAIDRLGALARTDSLLFQADDELFAPAGSYLCEVAGKTVQFFGGHQVALDCDIAPLTLSGFELRSLGMVLHELITNAMKHAFPSGAGRIKVRLLDRGENVAELSVIDDGVGIAAEHSSHPARGTGIMAELVRQLGGELSIRPLDTKGTLASVVFRVTNSAADQLSSAAPR